jgi:hypothetical protein
MKTYSRHNADKINMDLFDRRRDPIYKYIIAALKAFEVFPFFKLVSWDYITDPSKIDIKLNKNHIKNKKIKNNKNILKLVSIRDTASDLLVVRLKLSDDNDNRFIEKRILIPKYVDKYHLMVEGNKILPILQIVDNSTYNYKGRLKLKTTLLPIELFQNKVILTDINGIEYKSKEFVLNIFGDKHPNNPLVYFMADKGFKRTMKYFDMDGVIDVVDEIYNTDINHYFKINERLFLEVDKRYFENDTVRRLCSNILILFDKKDNITTLENDVHWLTKLGAIFTTSVKNQYNKGTSVLYNFHKVLDDITRNILRLDMRNKKTTFSIIRWMIQNFDELRLKDNQDLKNKRLRCNEYIAYYFANRLSNSLYKILNKNKYTLDSVAAVFNFNENVLFRELFRSKTPCPLLRYDPGLNNLEFYSAIKWSIVGPGSLTGTSNKVSPEFRDVNYSHFGRIDPNAISAGSPGLTGLVCPTTKLYDGLFFAPNSDPESWVPTFKKLKESIYDPAIDMTKANIAFIKDKKEQNRIRETKLVRDANGYIVIKERDLYRHDNGYIAIFEKGEKILLEDADGHLRDSNGYIYIREKPKEYVRNREGYIIIKKKGFGDDINEKGVRCHLTDGGSVMLSITKKKVKVQPKYIKNIIKEGAMVTLKIFE